LCPLGTAEQRGDRRAIPNTIREVPLSIDTEFRQVLANMEVWLQYGTSTSWEPSTSSGERSYGRPPGEDFPPHLEWRARWDRASVLEREKILGEARQDLKRLLKQKRIVVVPETQDELDKRIVLKCRQGWSVDEVANELKVTKKMVRLAWATAQTKPDETPSDQRAEAQRLALKGMTERQIVLCTGLPKSSVRRALGKAA
jgi:hypothetical protein